MKQNKNLTIVLLILIFLIKGVFAEKQVITVDPYKFIPGYRPVKLTIFWANMDEEREHTIYEYDKKNRLIKSSIFRGDTVPAWYTLYEYIKEDKLSKTLTYAGNDLYSSTYYTYIQDMLYEKADKDNHGNYTQIKQYEYNEQGKLFSIATRRAPYKETTLAWTTLEIYSYNADQRIHEKLEYYKGTLHNKSLYDYSDKSLVITTSYFGDLRDVSSKALKTFSYSSGDAKSSNMKHPFPRLGELTYTYINYFDGKEEVECCNTYAMVPQYEKAGNMTTLLYYNCEKELAGNATIVWEKKEADMKIIIEIFDTLHWYFTGC